MPDTKSITAKEQHEHRKAFHKDPITAIDPVVDQVMNWGDDHCRQVLEAVAIIPVFEKQVALSKKWKDANLLNTPTDELTQYENIETELNEAWTTLGSDKSGDSKLKAKIEKLEEQRGELSQKLFKFLPQYPEIRIRVTTFHDPAFLNIQEVFSPTKKIKSFTDKAAINLNSKNPIYSANDSDKKQVAIKTKNVSNAAGKQEFLNMVNTMASLRHDNIIPVSYAFLESVHYPTLGCIVTPFYENGNLLAWSLKANPSVEKLTKVGLFFPINL